MAAPAMHCVLVEPFYGGSHAQLLDWLIKDVCVCEGVTVTKVTFPARKWQWKLRASSLAIAAAIPPTIAVCAAYASPGSGATAPSGSTAPCAHVDVGGGTHAPASAATDAALGPGMPIVTHHTPGEHAAAAGVESKVIDPAATTLFVTSMANLAEVLALRPDLLGCKKVLYFHENQLAYPSRTKTATGEDIRGGDAESRDFHFGWAQITSALSADICAFNSVFNMESFLGSIERHIRQIPEKALQLCASGASSAEMNQVVQCIRERSVVCYFPVSPPPSLPSAPRTPDADAAPLHIVWNHRWEYDKGPELFFAALDYLVRNRVSFRVSVLGEAFAERPAAFEAARARLSEAGVVHHWGYAESRNEYWRILLSADVVVSTAIHEFFGVAIVEAVRAAALHRHFQARPTTTAHDLVQVLAGCYPLCPARLAYPEILAPSEADQHAASHATSRIRALSRSPAVPWWMRVRQACGVDAPPKAERFIPFGDRIDPRMSEHLYKNDRELQKTLLDMCKYPAGVRAWTQTAREEAGMPKSTAACTTTAASGTMDMDVSDAFHAVNKFRPERLVSLYVSLLQR